MEYKLIANKYIYFFIKLKHKHNILLHNFFFFQIKEKKITIFSSSPRSPTPSPTQQSICQNVYVCRTAGLVGGGEGREGISVV